MKATFNQPSDTAGPYRPHIGVWRDTQPDALPSPSYLSRLEATFEEAFRRAFVIADRKGFA